MVRPCTPFIHFLLREFVKMCRYNIIFKYFHILFMRLLEYR